MNTAWTPLQLALRERRRVVLMAAIWLVLTVISAIAGPFGTHDALGLLARFAYWGVIVAVSMISSVIPYLADRLPRPLRVAMWLIYVAGISGFVFGLNAMVFESWTEWSEYVYLLGIVGVTVLAVHAVFWIIDFARPVTPAPATDPQARFLRRLPLADRGPLVRIEAQDHYLNVVTSKGSALILMRLSEAVEELHEANGMMVHRSHWVALDAVSSHVREKGRDVLVMSDGARVPVSRSNKAAAQAAGLF